METLREVIVKGFLTTALIFIPQSLFSLLGVFQDMVLSCRGKGLVLPEARQPLAI